MDSVPDPKIEEYRRQLAEVEIEAFLARLDAAEAEQTAVETERVAGLVEGGELATFARERGLLPAYLVRRGYTVGDLRAERGEIVIPTKPFWQGLVIPEWMIDQGFLEPLSVEQLDGSRLPCPCGRLWATRQALAAHGCCDLPPEDAATPAIGGDTAVLPGEEPRGRLPESASTPDLDGLPRRLKDLQRWTIIWGIVREEWDQGSSYDKMIETIKRKKGWKCSTDTLRHIIRAGTRGQLG